MHAGVNSASGWMEKLHELCVLSSVPMSLLHLTVNNKLINFACSV